MKACSWVSVKIQRRGFLVKEYFHEVWKGVRVVVVGQVGVDTFEGKEAVLKMISVALMVH